MCGILWSSTVHINSHLAQWWRFFFALPHSFSISPLLIYFHPKAFIMSYKTLTRGIFVSFIWFSTTYVIKWFFFAFSCASLHYFLFPTLCFICLRTLHRYHCTTHIQYRCLLIHFYVTKIIYISSTFNSYERFLFCSRDQSQILS